MDRRCRRSPDLPGHPDYGSGRRYRAGDHSAVHLREAEGFLQYDQRHAQDRRTDSVRHRGRRRARQGHLLL